MDVPQSKLGKFGFDTNLKNSCPYSTRYRGSKQKIVDWIWEQIKNLKFNTVLDAMGGTGSIAYKAKKEGKKVYYNDKLKFNFLAGKGLIENNTTKLTKKDVNFILKEHKNISYPSFIQNTFKDIYFTEEENAWVDRVITNINQIDDEQKKALAMYCLFQSCIIKRPYNLFHRKNLYVRLSDVKRNFGNKTTWDKPFTEHFMKFVEEANNCVIDNGKKCQAMNHDVFEIPIKKYDLVYIDTPYIPKRGEIVDYRDAYHFLEGLSMYDKWAERIDHKRKHKPLIREECIWNNKQKIKKAFDNLFKKFQDSIIVVSYRSDGIPSQEEFVKLLKKYKSDVREVSAKNFKYVLSKKDSRELLFIAL